MSVAEREAIHTLKAILHTQLPIVEHTTTDTHGASELVFALFKDFVTSVAEAAARAHREGGFLGIGAKEISDREQRALDEISATLASRPS